MQAFELIEILYEGMKRMSEIGIKMEDYKHLPMCMEYKKSLPAENKIVEFVDETINDPDCVPQSVLACFRAKMDVMGIPIHWERYI